jgi:hypothetical protein
VTPTLELCENKIHNEMQKLSQNGVDFMLQMHAWLVDRHASSNGHLKQMPEVA